MEETSEDNENDKYDRNDKQMYCALSFCIMLVLVGIPLWWKTTEVYRVSLPYSEIDSLHNLNLQIKMNIFVATVDKSHGSSLIIDLENLFKLSKLYKMHIRQQLIDRADIHLSKSIEEIESKIKHSSIEGSVLLIEIPDLVRISSDSIVIGQYRTVYFSSNTSALSLFNFLKEKILKEDSLTEIISQINLQKKTDLNLKHKMPPSDDFDILFTILNPEPDVLDVRFDITQSIEEYIKPFLRNLEDMNGFHVKSQWLHFVTLQVQPKFLNTSERGPHYALSQDLLPYVITPLEKKLASHVSKHPCLNFVLFVAPCSLSPLKIYSRKGFPVKGADAFISPRWGGIQIHNPDRESCLSDTKVTVKLDKHYIMTVFIMQLKLLLGISDSSTFKEKDTTTSSVYLQLWEKDSLLRMRTVEQLTSAKLTIQSLSKLLGKISNIVINDDVGSAIYSALGNINKATEALGEGMLSKAYNNSKTAFLSSEKAFMDPSLLALLYFPDDQKYAVYIPLFLPIMIPILISFKRIKQWAEKKFSKSDKQKRD